ncbi:Gas vesicle protein GvpL/GvpF [Candidatus Magnetomorum sp. HK-1]|nr:Gas vesicle protein GvpL/GvpF [Candidatus Magnetomorum sp. HK-1]
MHEINYLTNTKEHKTAAILPIEKTSKQGLYLYCIADTNFLKDINGSGIDQKEPLFLKQHNNIVAVLSQIKLSDFIGIEAEEQLQDINWIGPRALRHQEIITQVMEISPVLPARFGTIFSDTNELDIFFNTHTKTIYDFLQKVDKHEEWSIKGFIDKKAMLKQLTQAEIEKNKTMLNEISPGKRYFQEKKIQKNVEKKQDQHIKELIQVIYDKLPDVYSDFSALKIFSKQSTGESKDMIFNWAFLILCDQLSFFQDALDDLENFVQQYGVELKITGPWPPSSFCPEMISVTKID